MIINQNENGWTGKSKVAFEEKEGNKLHLHSIN